MTDRPERVTDPPERIQHMGVVLEIDPAVMAPRIVEAIKRGVYEKAEARIVKSLIKEGDVALELGAGIGLVTTVMASDSRVAKIVAYEADVQLADIARKTLLLNNISNNGRVDIRNAVVSNSITTPFVEFYVSNEFWMSSLQNNKEASRVDAVRVDRFNEVLHDVKPDLIVCDIEGGELDLFADADLRTVARILVELHQYRIGDKGIMDLFSSLHVRGFCYDQYRSERAVVCFYRAAV